MIEDNPAFVQCLQFWLPRRVYAVASLREAMAAMKARRWNRIILDLGLPDADAEITTTLIPALKLASHDARIIVLTGTDANVNRLLKLGATAVLFKTEAGTPDKLLALL